MLNVMGLGSGYGRMPILEGINLSIAEGECVGLWGHNGMGKTTLLKTVMGYLNANAGSISFDGEDITKLPSHMRARMGVGLVQGSSNFHESIGAGKFEYRQRGDAAQQCSHVRKRIGDLSST